MSARFTLSRLLVMCGLPFLNGEGGLSFQSKAAGNDTDWLSLDHRRLQGRALCLATPTGVNDERNRFLSPEEEAGWSFPEEGRPRGRRQNRHLLWVKRPSPVLGRSGLILGRQLTAARSRERGRPLGRDAHTAVGNRHLWVVNVDRQAGGRGRGSGQVPKRPEAGVQGPASHYTGGSVWTVPQGPWLRNVPSPQSPCKHPKPRFEALLWSGATVPGSRIQTQPSSPNALSSSRTLSFRPVSGRCPQDSSAHSSSWYLERWPLPLSRSGFWKCETKAKILTVWLGTRSRLLG